MAELPAEFYVPAEEEQHELTFMQWPVSPHIYPTREELDGIQQVIARIANTIAEFEPVVMLAAKSDHAAARRYLGAAVQLWDIPTDDLWCRDSGALIARNTRRQRAVSHIQFNGWGRYTQRADEAVAGYVAQALDLPSFASGLVGEPGGAETNGHGVVMANASSWVNPYRNPDLDTARITERLRMAYGAERVIWGPGVKGQDVTDAHIDGMARFTAPNRVLMHLDDEAPDDPYTQSARILYDQLKADGFDIDLIPYAYDGRLDEIGYYVNFYVCNGAVIASQFGDAYADDMALRAINRHYPGREVITLNTDMLIELGGGIHCATQQLPAA